MGMFDEVRCDYPIPDNDYELFQTKDIAGDIGGTGSLYYIDPAGLVWYVDYYGCCEWVQDSTQPKPWPYKRLQTGKHGRVNVDNICRKMGWSRGRDEQKILDAQKTLKKEKVLVCKSQGYDEYYILPRGPLGATEDEVLTIKEGAKSNQIAKAFMKSSGSKTVNRQLLNKFIKMVA